ncbi:MAG TPA: response regulator [Patescibacteria group bacterium]|nr:response regulator [Patescibacteria group bacterium]
MNKVLLIEDDALLLSMYQDKFVHEGFTVETATDGETGINKMRLFQPDIVLLDLLLPEQSGFDVLKFAKQDPQLQNVPIIILTNAHADRDGMIKDWGVVALMLKAETTPEEVVQKVREVLPIPQQT